MIQGEHPVIPVPMLPRPGHEISEPVELAGCVPADCSPDALATAIEAAATTEVSDRRRQELLTARSPKAFADRILEILRLSLAEVP